MNVKTVIVALLVLVAALGLFVAFCGGREEEHGPPLQGAAELAALPDDRLEPAVISELMREFYQPGGSADFWRRIPSPARELWVTQQVPGQLARVGMEQWLKDQAAGSTSPGPADLAAAYRVLEQDEPAAVAQEIVAVAESGGGDPPALGRRLFAAIGTKACRQARMAWLRQHLRDVIRRD